jgi:transketolase
VIDNRSKILRRMMIQAMEATRRGHLGPAASLIEIIRVLYDSILCYQADKPLWPKRDRLILSKGHGCLALYTLLADKGFFPTEELNTFCELGSRLGGHPEMKVPGVEASTGSLGHGLSIGVGLALSARLCHRENRVFVIMGDGEINEGSVWEAAMSASKHRLSNLTALIDCNKFQSYGPTSEVVGLDPLCEKFQAFGFETMEVDGHDVFALTDLLKRLPFRAGAPSAIICHTIKGKGFLMAEGKPDWHHKSKLSDAELAALYADLE